MAFGTTPTSTTTLGTNQFPVSAVAVPGEASGNLTALEGGPESTDANGNLTAPASVYLKDGNDVATGKTTDAANANTVIGQLKQIKTNTASVVIGSGTLTANIGTTGGLALDTSINGVIVAQGSTTSGQKGALTQGAVTTSAPIYTTGQTSPLSLTTAGALRVDNSANTQPVSGTITIQALTGTALLADQTNSELRTSLYGKSTTAGDTAIAVDASGNVGTNVIGALPAGANNIGKVNIQASGTSLAADNTNELRVSMYVKKVAAGDTVLALGQATMANSLPVAIASDQGAVPVSGTITANAGTGNFNNASVGATGAAVPASASYLAGNKSGNLTGISLDGSGNLNVNVAAGGASGGTSSSFGSAFPATGTASGFSDGANMQGARAFDADTGAGTQYVAGANLRISASGGSIEAKGQQTMTNSIPVTLASDQGAVPVSGTITANAGTGTFTNQQSNITTDYDTGAGTQTMTMFGVALPASGGSVAGGTATNPLRTDPTGTTTQPVSGTVTANQGGSNWSTNTVQLNGTTIDTNSGIKSAGTQRVVLATDQPALTNALKVDGSAVTQPVSGTITANGGTGPFPVAGMVASGASNANNPVKVGGAFNTTQPTVTTGQVVDAQYSARGAALVATGTDTFNVTVNAALPTGSNVIGHVIADSGSTTAVTQATASNLNAQVQGAAASGAAQSGNPVKVGGVFNTTQPTVTTGQAVDAQYTARGASIVATGTDTFNVTVNAALPTGGNTIGAVTQASGPWTSNVTQFGGTNVATGTGAGGTGIPRVTVSNDSQIQVWDGTNGPVAVKAANTSTTLADKSLVHMLSPNNTGLPVNTPSIVQSTNNKSSGSVASLAKAFASNNVAGNSIVVVCGVGNGTAPTITDSNSNTYTQAAQIANSTALNVAVFYAVGIVGGANTVTVNNGGTTASIAMEIYEVSGFIAQVQAQPDQTASATGSSGTAATVAIGALTPNEYAFAGVGVGTAAQTIAAGTGWTNDSGQQNPTTPAGLFSFVSMSQYLASLKYVTPQATFTSEPWAIAVATFRPVLLGIEGAVIPQAGATGGSIPSHTMSAASTNATSLKAAPGQVYGLSISNANAAARYFKLYNKASAPTVGTDTPVLTVQVPANGTVIRAYPVGLALSTGIAWAATGVITDADTTAIGANDLSIDIDYK